MFPFWNTDVETAGEGGDDDGDGWPYRWTEETVEHVEGQPVVSTGKTPDGDSEVFAGPLAREMITGARENPDQPLYIGVGTRRGRHAAIEKKYLFRHTCVFGVTGYGKSTLLKNASQQVIEAGSGCVFIDPKGDDSEELMQAIPDHRLDDVVWVEPGSSRSAVAGFNFLDVGLDESHPRYDTAVENVVADLVKMVGLDDYWGPLMDGVTSTLIRATTRMEYDFTLLDLYYILATEENRQQYADLVNHEGLEFLSVYSDKIAELDDSDLDALRRRFKDWVEDPEARQVISYRDTDIDIESIVSEGKILIVRMSEQREELKQMIGTAILRRVWSAIRSRSVDRRSEREPFYLFCDEFDLVATQDSAVTTMLSKARSLALSLFLCCQQPEQLPDSVVAAMYGNCDTVLSFSPGSPGDSKAVAQNLGMNWQTLRNESNYHVWMQLTLSETRERSEAFRVYTLPPFPPRRSVASAQHAIERSVREHGRPHQTDDELRDEIIIGGGAQLTLDDEGVLGGDEPGDVEVTPDRLSAVLKSMFSLSVSDGDDEGYVDTEALSVELRSLGLADTHLASVIHDCSVSGYLDISPTADRVRLTDEGRVELFGAGASAAGGTLEHRSPAEYLAHEAAKIGYRPAVETQDGEEKADLTYTLPPEASETVQTQADLDEKHRVLREEYPAVWALGGDEDVAVELEKATQEAPDQTIRNLRKHREPPAGDPRRHVLFIVWPRGDDDCHNARRLDRKLRGGCVMDDSHTPNDAMRRFHHTDDRVTPLDKPEDDDNRRVFLPSDISYEWVDEGDGSVLLRTSAGIDVARFGSELSWRERTPDSFGTPAVVEPEAAGEEAGLTPVYAPNVPEWFFDDVAAAIDPAGWTISVLPRSSDDSLGIYDAEEDETVALSDVGGREDAPAGDESEEADNQRSESAGAGEYGENDLWTR